MLHLKMWRRPFFFWWFFGWAPFLLCPPAYINNDNFARGRGNKVLVGVGMVSTFSFLLFFVLYLSVWDEALAAVFFWLWLLAFGCTLVVWAVMGSLSVYFKEEVRDGSEMAEMPVQTSTALKSTAMQL